MCENVYQQILCPQYQKHWPTVHGSRFSSQTVPGSKVHGANMGPIWGRQDPGGPHVGPMNFAIWGTAEDWNTLQGGYGPGKIICHKQVTRVSEQPSKSDSLWK